MRTLEKKTARMQWMHQAMRMLAWSMAINIGLHGCAAVDARSNKEPLFTQKIDHIAIWSGVSRITYFSGPLKPSEPFPETFKRSLMAHFAEHGIAATYMELPTLPEISPEDTQTAKQQETGNPDTRLVISVKDTASMRYGGFTHLDKAVFDLSLYSIATGQRVWRAEIGVDTTFDVPKWNAGTADKFAGEIFTLLQKDGLLSK